MILLASIIILQDMLKTSNQIQCNTWIQYWLLDDAKNATSKSRGPRTLLMAPAQQEETILVEGTGVVPAKCSPKIKSELFSLL